MNVVIRVLRRSAGILVRPSSQHAELTAIASSSRLYSAATTSRPTSSKLDDLVQNLWAAKDSVAIHQSYSALAQEVKNPKFSSFPSPSPGDKTRLLSILQLLAASGRPEDLTRIEEILRDLYPVLGMEPTREVYTSLLRTFVKHGHDQEAYGLLMKMPQLPGQFKSTLHQIHFVLKACSEFSTIQFLQKCVSNMSRMGHTPGNDSFAILIEAHWRIATRDEILPNIDEFSSVVREYVRQGMTFDPLIADLLYQGYANLEQFPQAHEILAVYESASKPVDIQKEVEPLSDNSIRSDAELQNPPRKESKTKRFGIMINNCIKSGDYKEAFHIYEESKQAGIPPSSALVFPLLVALLHRKFEVSLDQAVDRALDIYRDLSEAFPPSQDDSDETSNERLPGPDARIYSVLLRMLLSSPNINKCTPIAESLLDDMQLRGVPIGTNELASSSIMLEMRRTGRFSDAFEYYREHRSKLDERGFLAVLHEYARLSFSGDLEVPLITEYFSIVNDMRLQRIPVTRQVYTVILYQIGMTASRLGPMNPASNSMYTRLVDTTRRIHDFLTLDASISPDAVLWNQLMNTYQRLGRFADAYRLWELMLLTGRYDQRTVNIMIDACGYAGQLKMAKSILDKVANAGFKLDSKNWDTWLECLCRNQQFDSALKVMAYDMKRNGMEPSIESARIFRKFARKYECWEGYRALFMKSLPELWKCLPQQIRDP